MTSGGMRAFPSTLVHRWKILSGKIYFIDIGTNLKQDIISYQHDAQKTGINLFTNLVNCKLIFFFQLFHNIFSPLWPE